MKYIGLDVESESLEAKNNASVKLWCVSFSEYDDNGKMTTLSLRWNEAKDYINNRLQDEDVIFVIHNASFDIAVLRCRGIVIPCGRYICTRLMFYTWRTGEQNSLDHISRTYLNDSKDDFIQTLKDKGLVSDKLKKDEAFSINYDEHPEAFKILCEYCEKDAQLTLRIFNWLNEDVYSKDDKLSNAFYSVELPYIEVLMDMEATGMYIDVNSLSELDAVVSEELNEVNTKIDNAVGLLPESVKFVDGKYLPVEKNYKNGVSKNKNNGKLFYGETDVLHPQSSDPSFVYDHCKIEPLNIEKSHFSWYLMERLGWKPEKYSKKTGEPTTDRQVMVEISDDFDIISDIQQSRELTKLKGSFIDKINTIAAKCEYPFVRCQYNQCKTVTTRLSSSDPNLQNIPSRSKLGKRIRDSVIAPQGYDVWVADLDAIELRVLAFYLALVVDEWRMYEEFQKPDADPHTANQIAWGLESRSLAKKIFSVIYGGQAAAVGRYGNNGTPEEGQKILDAMKDGMPKLWELMDAVWSVARKRDGLLYTWYGNPIHYPDLNSRDKWKRARAERQSFNCLIQGTAAGINKELGIQVNDPIRKYGGCMAFAVHDEYGAYIPSENNNYFRDEANIIYNNRSILSFSKHNEVFSIPVTGTWNMGDNWNTAKAGG